ncbi:energy transducer TonB [Algoriphagus litoralis]|uniref:energy transducer TonB n=1 Tax=Algoriphagus litoralis TaxID=2202829 RepID=UPI0013004AC3|nr:energy transducer TonB [Algoriphagus litoralis]
MRKSSLFVILLFISLVSAKAQQLDYLNSYWYTVQDTSKYPFSHYRITLEDSMRKSVRIFTRDSTLVYQRVEMLPQRKEPMTQTEVWYADETGIKIRSAIYSEKKKRKETTRFYESGQRKSLTITEDGEVLKEIYFSETGQEMPVPEIIQALPKDGIAGWNTYLGQNLVYPEDARFLGKEGLVYLHFFVTEEGKMEEIEIMNPEENHPSLNKEAFRVVSKYPHSWTPCIEDGKVIRSEMRLPIRFKLAD